MSEEKAVRRGFFNGGTPEERSAAARKAGKAAHAKGTAHKFTKEEAQDGGRKGGEVTSQDREHMARIGQRGGLVVSQDREHMAKLGRKDKDDGD